MQKKYFLPFFFTFLSIQFGFSQYRFDQIQFNSIKEGLSKRGVNSILEDKDGFMWFGLDGAGLYRFDGSNFKQYLYKNGDSTSINGNFILSNYIDNENRMWVGTNFGLNLYNQDLGTFEQIDTINKINPSGELRIRCIIQSDQNHLFLGTNDFGVIKFNVNTYQVYLVPFGKGSQKNVDIRDFTFFDGRVYGVTNKGLFVFDESENIFKLVELNTKDGVQTISNSIESCTVDHEKNMWLGTTKNGLIKVSFQNDIPIVHNFSFTQKRILSLITTNNNQMFCSAENEGLFLVDKVGNKLNEYSFQKFSNKVINSNSIWSLFNDSQNRIWVGTFNKGVSVYDKLYSKFDDIKSLPNNSSFQGRAVSNILEDDLGKIWIGMDGGGIDIYDPITKQLQTLNTEDDSDFVGLTSNDIVGMRLDRKGNIWAGSWGEGIYFLKKGTNEFVNFTKKNTNGNLTSNRIYNFCEDSSGRIWVATFDSGLIYYEPRLNKFFHCNSKEFETHGLTYNQIRSVKVDRNENVWVGTTIGLFKIKFEEDSQGKLTFDIVSYKKQMLEKSHNHPSTNNISSLYLTSDNQFLIGTEGAGLYIMNNQEDIRHYRNEKFEEKIIGSIIEDQDKTIWVSGANGIANISLNSDKVITYDKDDGFLSNYFYINSVCSAKDGTIYYGNDMGLNYFKPNEIKTNNILTKLHFTSFKIFNKEITPLQKDSPLHKVISKTKEITLNDDQRVFTISYVGINFTRPEKNQYAYQLEGVDPDWRYVGTEQNATYTNLKTGNYVFKVKATNSDGLWTEDPLELKIEILPPWWRSNLAYFSYFLLFLGSLFYLNKFIQQRLNEKQIVQIERQKRLQEEQLSQQKLEFFTNISHEFRTPLTLIINPLEDIIKNKNFDLPNEVERKHQIIYKNSHRLNRLINELMDFRKLQFHKMTVQAEQVEIVNHVKETLSYFSEEANVRNIDLEFQSYTDTLIAWIDVSMLEKIIFNLVSNAFKVTPNNGKITISINEKVTIFPSSKFTKPREGFEISINDTGGGLTESEISQIFQRFSQVNKTKNKYYGGTGIGLEVVKALTELHGGKIEVLSKVGKGSNFIVSFLLGREHFSNEEILFNNYRYSKKVEPSFSTNMISLEKTNGSKGSKRGKPSSKEYSLLIVEDNLDLRNYLKMELEKDYDILLADNGKVAYEIALKETPHLILTDVMMPLMDGLELCKKIKEDLKTSHIPLLMLTAKSMKTDKLEGINCGADAFLSKPIEMELLKSTLNQLLTSRQILFNKFSKGGIEIDKKASKKISSLDNAFIKKVVEHIHENLGNSELTVESIANHFFLSRSQLYRKTKSLTGMTVNEFIKKVRLEKANKMIKVGEGNISEISYKVGFSSPSYFAKCFKDEFGKLPTEVNP